MALTLEVRELLCPIGRQLPHGRLRHMAISKARNEMEEKVRVQTVSRRTLLYGAVSAGGLLLLGCSQENGKESGSVTAQQGSPVAGAQKASMVVYRDPSCGCCTSWATIARTAGYEVTVLDDPDMAAVKNRLGVPEDLASCHTATVGSVVIEGHVPMDDVARLLASSGSIKGIAVPGMPLGSPGMEMPDGTKEPYQVIAFREDGQTSIFSTHNS